MYEKLFSSTSIGNLTIKNRLVMAPMGIGLANLDGSASDEMIEFYEQRAQGGAGIIIPEITRVNDVHGAGEFRQLSVTKDRHIESIAKLACAIHKHGSKIFIQLHHPGRETSNALIGGQKAVSASAIPCKVTQAQTRALETDEVKALVQDFINGAIRVKMAGCDGVELHAAHGYLLQQFLSPYTNKRTDEYGGNFENRMRFVAEIIQGIKSACGADFVLGMRLSVEEFLNQVGVTEDYIHIEDGVKIVKYFENLGIDFIDVSVGLYETGITAIEPISFAQGWRRNFIKAVKDQVNILVIAVSVFREPQIAEQFLQEGILDFVSMGRQWLADANWGKKVQEGREYELRKCINCLRCFESLFEYNGIGLPAECAINPLCARELKYGDLQYDTDHHKVVVIGGGPSGMCAAETLAKRGVQVILMDRQQSLGGTVNLAKLPPLKERMEWIADYYRDAFKRLDVEVRLNTEVTAQMVAELKPDAVIVATGSKPIIPKQITGADGANVYTVESALKEEVSFVGRKVAVVGAGLTGLETAEFIASKGSEVVIVDMLKVPAPNAYKTNVLDVMSRLKKFNVKLMLGQALVKIEPDGIVVRNVDDEVMTKVDADAIVMSLGYKADNEIANELKAMGIQTIVTGSAIKDGTIAPAMRTGYEAARLLFTDDKKPSFVVSNDDIKQFTAASVMNNQEGIYLAYLTDPKAIERILPPGLKPFSLPVVVVSCCHIHNPSFADDYYEAILGVYCMHQGKLGQYSLGLILGGPGAEMATQCGRDNASIPKKLGGEFQIRRNKDHVTASVARRGVRLIEIDMKLGEYNHPLTHLLFQKPGPNVRTTGSGFYYHFDRKASENGGSEFGSGQLQALNVEYEYESWEPGFVDLKLTSSIDDPFAELPINTIIGGAYAKNHLTLNRIELLEKFDTNEIVPYLLTARYDRTAFKESFRK